MFPNSYTKFSADKKLRRANNHIHHKERKEKGRKIEKREKTERNKRHHQEGLCGPESPRKQPSAFLSTYALGQWPAGPWDAGVCRDG